MTAIWIFVGLVAGAVLLWTAAAFGSVDNSDHDPTSIAPPKVREGR